MTCEDRPDWVGFGMEVMECWPLGGCDGFELEEAAIKHRIIRKVPGGFDPTRHEDVVGIFEPGDDWYELNYRRPGKYVLEARNRRRSEWPARVAAFAAGFWLAVLIASTAFGG